MDKKLRVYSYCRKGQRLTWYYVFGCFLYTYYCFYLVNQIQRNSEGERMLNAGHMRVLFLFSLVFWKKKVKFKLVYEFTPIFFILFDPSDSCIEELFHVFHIDIIPAQDFFHMIDSKLQKIVCLEKVRKIFLKNIAKSCF